MSSGARTVFRLAGGRLEWRADEGSEPESRPVDGGDAERFREWAHRYDRLLELPAPAAQLRELGREMARWLDGDGRWLERARGAVAAPPWIVELAVPRQPAADAEARFLHAPWELLADAHEHLAGQEDLLCAPVRRLGEAGEPLPPSPLRLAAVFMAAAPEGATTLSYEEEETAILDATGAVGMDLTVEETGTLDLLADCVADVCAAADDGAELDVLHLSCHGSATPRPTLFLEDDEGRADPVAAERLMRSLGLHLPRLLVLSACETGAPGRPSPGREPAAEVTGSLAAAAIRGGAAAVLGWGGSVGDADATRFAASLYAGLARHGGLEEVVARARLELLRPLDGEPSPDWHLARLWLGARGGGVLTRGRRARWGRGREGVHKAFLDAREQRVPVAGPREFVGRRRQIREVLRELRRGDAERPAGILIHGLGRQGKSSLAARIAQRLRSPGGSDHALAVLYGRYDAPAAIAAIASALGSAEGEDWQRRWRPAVEASPRQLEVALRELLEGPCRQAEPPAAGQPARRSLLLVADDFEQALEVGSSGEGLLQPELVEPVRAVILAFRRADTTSRLLFTSRYGFTLPHEAATWPATSTGCPCRRCRNSRAASRSGRSCGPPAAPPAATGAASGASSRRPAGTRVSRTSSSRWSFRTPPPATRPCGTWRPTAATPASRTARSSWASCRTWPSSA